MIPLPCSTWGDLFAITRLLLHPRSWRRYAA